MKRHNLFIGLAMLMALPRHFSVDGSETGGAGGTNTPAAPTPPSVDVDAIKQATLAEAQAAFAEQLKAATGFASFDELKADKLKADGKLQELADTKGQEASAYKAKYEQTLIGNALLSSAADAVAALAGKGVVDANGNVSIGGKPPAEAVKILLAQKPHWAKAQGVPGSSSPALVVQASHSTQTQQLSGLALLQAARKGE